MHMHFGKCEYNDTTWQNTCTLMKKYTHSYSYSSSYSHRSSEHPVYGLEELNHSTYTHTTRHRDE